MKHKNFENLTSRRDLFRAGFAGLGIGTVLPAFFGQASEAMAAPAFQASGEARPERIMVVVELNGGNDGLDTIIPWRDDGYRKSRPTLGLGKDKSLPLSDDFGLHPSLGGLKRLWDQGLVAAIHGCGYPNPDRSHFSSMEYWHTAMPHQAETTGWVGRFADERWPAAPLNTVVNVGQKQSLAVQAVKHAPVVFNRPEEFARAGDATQGAAYRRIIDARDTGNASLDFLAGIARNAADTSARVREATRGYQTPVGYGSTPLGVDLKKVAALIHAGFPTRVYYVSLGGFDTHAGQQGGRFYLLTGLAESLEAFFTDLKRMGRQNDVGLMMFSEFGRRVEENASLGTDHGTAGPMFLMGRSVKPGFYGTHPSLTDLDDNGDLKMTIDFRRVYSTLMSEWMGFAATRNVLRGDFPPLGVFRS